MAILKVISHGKTNAGTRRLLQYVLDPKKTQPELCAVSGDFTEDAITPHSVYSAFTRTRDIFRKNRDGSRTYTHGTVSFPPGEITAEDAATFAAEFVERVYPAHQVLTTVHTDADHIHAHFVVEPVSYVDGSMLHTKKQDLEEAKKICNEMCRERSLSVARKGRHADGSVFEDGEVTTWSKARWHQMAQHSEDSFLVDLALAVQDCSAAAESREEFCELMEQQYGWRVIWKDSRKNLTFENTDGKRVRDTNLNKTFNLTITKEALQYEFARNSGRQAIFESPAGKTAEAELADRAVERRESMAERTAGKGNRARR